MTGQIAPGAPAVAVLAGSLGAADITVQFISILSTVLVAAIIIRAILSWFMPNDGTGLLRVLMDVTEPVLAPIRRILPPVGGLDLSPILAIVAIEIVGQLLIRALSPAG